MAPPPSPRRQTRQGRRFHEAELGPWLGVVLAGLVATTSVPIAWPETQGWFQRTTPLLSLFFFLAAIGHWMRMRTRAFVVAGALTALVYGLTAWTPIAVGYEDFFVVALLSSFLIFALAGFNLIFILEEIVYDLQRVTQLRHPAWRFGPTLLVLALAWLLPAIGGAGPDLKATWIVAIADLVILGSWWFLRAFNPIPEGPILKELHLLVVTTLLMGLLIDITGMSVDAPRASFSFIPFFILVGTWLYVTYTTLQRTHFLLGGNNAVPWLLIMLSASFALVQHSLLHFRVEGTLGVQVILTQRLGYLVAGLAVGMAVYVVHAVWRVLRSLRDERNFSPRSRIIAGRFARVAEGVLSMEERLLKGTAYQVYAGMDKLLPGHHRAPRHQGWELDMETGKVSPIRADEEE